MTWENAPTYKPLTDEDYLRLAGIRYADGSDDDIELDEEVSLSRDVDGCGAWVRAWVWVDAPLLEDDS